MLEDLGSPVRQYILSFSIIIFSSGINQDIYCVNGFRGK